MTEFAERYMATTEKIGGYTALRRIPENIKSAMREAAARNDWETWLQILEMVADNKCLLEPENEHGK